MEFAKEKEADKEGSQKSLRKNKHFLYLWGSSTIGQSLPVIFFE
ncbi:hypothetical protein JOE21_001158 [Desmospora profundinema]|uniref:Uncharacterized protein n=1 Tax=Desmospora profundinema TaxID=1571184 RepID=A0ABU1IK57_9BACL|nr:hypothetical protein [Desmospora profundinema]